jgi:chromosome segregation ATPase
MKTIKQISDELGVSKQKVYRFIVKNHITASGEVKQSKLYDKAAEKLIKQGILENESYQKSHHEAHQNHINDTVSEVVIELIRKELEQKNEQLQEKDRQIREKDRQLAEMQAQLSESQKLIDQEQQLRMVTERKFQLIEQQQDQEEPDTAEDKKWWQFWK